MGRRMLGIPTGQLVTDPRFDQAAAAMRMACQSAAPSVPILMGLYREAENGQIEVELDELRTVAAIVGNTIPFVNATISLLRPVLPRLGPLTGSYLVSGTTALRIFESIGQELLVTASFLAGWIQQAQQAPDQEILINAANFNRYTAQIVSVGTYCDLLFLPIIRNFARMSGPSLVRG